MTRFARVIVLLLFTSAPLACGDDDTQQPTGPGPSGPTATTSVSIVDNAFNPSAITVNAGATVNWTWNGSNPHNVTFDDASVGNSSTKTTGGFTRTFNTAGTFTYFCTVHGRSIMSGSVQVN